MVSSTRQRGDDTLNPELQQKRIKQSCVLAEGRAQGIMTSPDGGDEVAAFVLPVYRFSNAIYCFLAYGEEDTLLLVCWEKSEAVRRNVEAWGRLNPDFEIKEWNESNTDVSAWEFGRRAWRARKCGFLVDIIRPLKLYEEGGFYLDADVELIRPLSALDAGSNGEKLLMGYMYGCALGTAVLYAPPRHPYILDILRSYNYIRPDKWPVSNSILRRILSIRFPVFC